MSRLEIRTGRHSELLEITARVQEAVGRSGVQEGICLVYVPHTTAGVTINENADPTVVQDLLKELGKIVPLDHGYRHGEGNSAAHIKATLVGASVQLPVASGRLSLGTWQGIYFCEFDGPRSRSVMVQVLGQSG